MLSTSPGQPNPNLWQSVTTGSCPKSTKTMHKEVCLFFFTPWSYTRQHHHTTTPPGVFHTQTRWPPLSAVTAMVSSQPGASQRTFVWPRHPAALAPGLLGVGLAIQPFFDSLLPGSCPMPMNWARRTKKCLHVCACMCVCAQFGKYQQLYHLSVHCNGYTDPPVSVATMCMLHSVVI